MRSKFIEKIFSYKNLYLNFHQTNILQFVLKIIHILRILIIFKEKENGWKKFINLLFSLQSSKKNLKTLVRSDIFIIEMRNGKIVWKYRVELLIFQLELDISGIAVHEIHQNSEKLGAFSDYFLIRDDHKVVIAIFVVMAMLKCFWGSSEDRYRWRRLA